MTTLIKKLISGRTLARQKNRNYKKLTLLLLTVTAKNNPTPPPDAQTTRQIDNPKIPLTQNNTILLNKRLDKDKTTPTL